MKITHVAIKTDDKIWSLPAPNRHHHILRDMFDCPNRNYNTEIQGFLTEDDTFLGRHEAYQLAAKTGQIDRRVGNLYYQGPELFSEDLW